MLGKFNISCEKAVEICNKSQYNESSFSEKVKLYIHVFFCKNCATYVKQNNFLTRLCKKVQSNEEEACMSFEDKETLKNKLKEMQN